MPKWLQLGIPKDRLFKLGLVLSLLQGLSAVALLGVSAWLISRAAEMPSIMYLGLAVVGVRGFALGKAVFRYAERLALHDSAFRMIAAKRPLIFSKLASTAPIGVSENGHGDTISKMVSDVNDLQNLPLKVIAPLVQSIGVAVVSLVALIWLLPSAAVAMAICLSVSSILAFWVTSKLSSAEEVALTPARALVAESNLELLQNRELLVAYGWQQEMTDRLVNRDQNFAGLASKIAISRGLGQGILSLFAGVATIAMTYLGALAVQDHRAAGVELAVFALLPMAIFEIAQAAQPAFSALRQYRASANRILGLLESQIPEALKIQDGKLELDAFESLTLTDVSVIYPGQSIAAISDFELELRPGQTAMLAGKSGSGKSTIASVLERFIEPATGRYLINSIAVQNFDSVQVRKFIGLVEQNPTVFYGDVRANLLVANQSASDVELNNALRQVGLFETFAERDGLATLLGDRGVLISGGEAQRLALARALLADFKVLVLDEPTANVDQATAHGLVKDLLAAATAGSERAVLLISHDKSFGALVDKVIQVD